MASMYRCEVKWPVSRGKGQSGVAKAAYNARDKLFNEREGKWTRDYGKADKTSRGHEDILFSGIFVDPKFKPPDWVQDRSQLWNRASRAEGTRKNALDGAQEMILNLPNDLSFEAQRRMTIDFVRQNITRGTGRVADVNIHAAPKTGDDRNVHVHILFTIRAIGPEGFTKDRLPEINREDVLRLRQKWAERGERELRRAGLDTEADRWNDGYLKLTEQKQKAHDRGDHQYAEACDREPTPHLGPHVRAMEAKGEKTRKGDKHKAVLERNEARAKSPKLGRGELKQPEGMGRTPSDIWLAYDESKSPRQFVNNLAEKGLHLVRITDADIDLSRPDFSDPRIELDQLNRQKRQGVWTLQNEGFRELDEKQKELAQQSYEKYLSKPKKDGREKMGIEKYVGYVQKQNGKRITDLVERGKTLDFADGGISPEAARQPILKAGDYAVLTESGTLYHLNKRTAGESREEVQKFLKPLDNDRTILTVSETRAAIVERWEKSQALLMESRMQRADASGRSQEKLLGKTDASLGKVFRAMQGVGIVAKAVEKVLDIWVGLFDLPTLTPAQERSGENARLLRDQEAIDAQRRRERSTERDR